MSAPVNVLIVGVGGQGVILVSKVLAWLAQSRGLRGCTPRVVVRRHHDEHLAGVEHLARGLCPHLGVAESCGPGH